MSNVRHRLTNPFAGLYGPYGAYPDLHEPVLASVKPLPAPDQSPQEH